MSSAEPSTQSGAESSPLVLQAVMLSPRGNAALIDGKMVAEGQKIGDARLFRVFETSVMLKSMDGKTSKLELKPSFSGIKTLPAVSVGKVPAKK